MMTTMKSLTKSDILMMLRQYCVDRSVKSSIKLAHEIRKNGEDVEEVLKKMGFDGVVEDEKKGKDSNR